MFTRMDRERIPLLNGCNGYIIEVVENGHSGNTPNELEEFRQVLTLDEVTFYSKHTGWTILRRFLFISLWVIFGVLFVMSWSTAVLHFHQYCPYRPLNTSDNFHK